MQGDLFGPTPIQTASLQNTSKLAFLEKRQISIRMDQALAGMIALLVIYVLIFSFGVEKGKRLGMAELKAERAKNQRMVHELSEKLFSNTGVPASALPQPAVIASLKETKEVVPSKSDETQAVSSAAAPAGKFTIQHVTYHSKQAAEREMKRLAEKGYQSFVIPKGRFWQVCINGFDSRKQATELLSSLKAQKIVAADAYVRAIPQGQPLQ